MFMGWGTIEMKAPNLGGHSLHKEVLASTVHWKMLPPNSTPQTWVLSFSCASQGKNREARGYVTPELRDEDEWVKQGNGSPCLAFRTSVTKLLPLPWSPGKSTQRCVWRHGGKRS